MNVFSILISIVAAAVAGFSMLTSFDANDQTQKLGASQKISELTSYTNPDDADSLPIVDAANATTKRITWANATSSLGTYFSTVYSPIFSTSAGLAGLLSDENGTGNFALSSSTALTSARLNAPVLDVVGTDATGDIYYNGGSGLLTRLAIGSTGQYLQISGGAPYWADLSGGVFTSSTTINATTTIPADNLKNRALVLNTLAYKFPSTRGASSTVLTEDGNGNVMWQSNPQSFSSTTKTRSSTTAQDFDDVFTTPFTPRTIIIYYRLNGQATSPLYSVGVATYNQTTLQSNMWYANNIAATASTQGSQYIMDTNNPSSGAASGGSDIKVELTIPSVTSTGFTVRTSFTIAESPTGTANYMVVAYP